MLYSLIEFPYKVALFILKKTMPSHVEALWPRHSYVTRDLVFLVSDLDLTLTVENHSRESSINIQKFFWFWKRLIPFLGEVNVISLNLLDKISPLAPILELRRDPQLLKLVAKKNVEVSAEEKLIFLKKMYASDKHNLEKRFARRIGKWSKHLASMGFVIGANEFSSKVHLDQFIEKNFLRISENDHFLLDLPGWLKQRALEKDWLDPAFEWPVVENTQLLQAALNWEIWGSFHQFSMTKDQLTWLAHVESCKRMAAVYQLKESQQAAEELSAAFAPFISQTFS